MAKQATAPKYYGLRIYMTAMVLFFFLILPFLGFMSYQQLPEILESRGGSLKLRRSLAANDSIQQVLDSSLQMLDSLSISLEDLGDPEVREVLEEAAEQYADSLVEALAPEGPVLSFELPGEEEEEISGLLGGGGPIARTLRLLVILMGVSLVAGLLYNLPFKIFFHRLRRRKKVPDSIRHLVRNWLIRTPVINSLIIIFPNVTVIMFGMLRLVNIELFDEVLEQRMYVQMMLLTSIATLLELLFVFYWQKHRVHQRYIHHVFDREELRTREMTGGRGRIRSRLAISAIITTFLPLVIVMAYLLLSLSSVKKMEKEYFNQDHREILLGPWSQLSSEQKEQVDGDEYDHLVYVNAFDTIIMLIGIGNGIFVSFIYLLLFVRWNNRDLVRPVRELLGHMSRDSRDGSYAIVRTNDEIGELAEGYNEMNARILEHVSRIETMNRELEDKVAERTREVVEQKEEIETQKEEIEAQLDLATRQRDTISFQNEQILDSIHYARRIQAALMPPVDLLEEKLGDHFLLFRPRDIVSGDFYWLGQKGSKLMVALADCTGHGVPGAFLSTLGISSLNTIFSRMRNPDPAKMLDELRKTVIASLHRDNSGGETRDGIEMAIISLDLEKGTLEYAGANRPLYLIRQDELEHLRPDRMSISIDHVDQKAFSKQERKLKKGDQLYLFSDGFVDQLGGNPRKTFRAIRFRKHLMEVRELSMSEQKERLDKALMDWQGQDEQIDDILVIGLQV